MTSWPQYRTVGVARSYGGPGEDAHGIQAFGLITHGQTISLGVVPLIAPGHMI